MVAASSALVASPAISIATICRPPPISLGKDPTKSTKPPDEIDEASGDGLALLEDDGSLSGEISFHRGDEATFKAKKW